MLFDAWWCINYSQDYSWSATAAGQCHCQHSTSKLWISPELLSVFSLCCPPNHRLHVHDDQGDRIHWLLKWRHDDALSLTDIRHFLVSTNWMKRWKQINNWKQTPINLVPKTARRSFRKWCRLMFSLLVQFVGNNKKIKHFCSDFKICFFVTIHTALHYWFKMNQIMFSMSGRFVLSWSYCVLQNVLTYTSRIIKRKKSNRKFRKLKHRHARFKSSGSCVTEEQSL